VEPVDNPCRRGTGGPRSPLGTDESGWDDRRGELLLLSRRRLDPPVGPADRTRPGDGRDQPISGVSVPRHESVSIRVPVRHGPRRVRPPVGREGAATHRPASAGRSRLRSTGRLSGGLPRGRSDRRFLPAGHHRRPFSSPTGRGRRPHGRVADPRVPVVPPGSGMVTISSRPTRNESSRAWKPCSSG